MTAIQTIDEKRAEYGLPPLGGSAGVVVCLPTAEDDVEAAAAKRTLSELILAELLSVPLSSGLA